MNHYMAQLARPTKSRTRVPGACWSSALSGPLPSSPLLQTPGVHVVDEHIECCDDCLCEVKMEVGIRPPFALEAFSSVEEDVKPPVQDLVSCPVLAADDCSGIAVRVAGYEI